jgi:hypothetical protein
MERGLRSGEYAAVISDMTQLISRVNRDTSCTLHVLPGVIEPFDIAFAFSKDFPYLRMENAIDSALLLLQENNILSARLLFVLGGNCAGPPFSHFHSP